MVTNSDIRLLNADDILMAEDLPTEVVPVPEWGGSVLVRGLMGAERDALEAEMMELRKNKVQINPAGYLNNLRAKLVARCVVDAEGNRLFSDYQIPALGQKSAAALDRVASKAQQLSGMSEKDVEELVGNSEPGPSDSSTSS